MIAIHKSMNTRRLLMWGDSETCSGFPFLNKYLWPTAKPSDRGASTRVQGLVYRSSDWRTCIFKSNETTPCLTRQITTQKHNVQPAPKTMNTFSPTEHVYIGDIYRASCWALLYAVCLWSLQKYVSFEKCRSLYPTFFNKVYSHCALLSVRAERKNLFCKEI